MTTFTFRHSLAAALMLLVGMTTTTGCTNTSRGAGAGAAAGGVVGAVIGRATGSTARGAIIGAAVGGTAGAVIGRQMDKQAEELDDDLENADVTPIPGDDGDTAGIAIRFDNALLFDLGQASLRSGVRADLTDLASSLRNYPDHDAVVVGHASTDGSTATNQTLSDRRARAVTDFLVGQGVPQSRLQSYGRGETEPLAGVPGTSPENRRVEIAIYPNETYRRSVENEYN